MSLFHRKPKQSTTIPLSVKYVIGIDAALRNVGVVVFDNMHNVVTSFNITTQSGVTDHSAIDYIIKELFERLAPYITNPRAVAVFIEEIAFSIRGDKTHSRAGLCGIIKWCFRQERINIWEVNNSAANSFLDTHTGEPKARRKSAVQKAHTIAVIHRHFGFFTQNDNIADAFVIGLFGLTFLTTKKRFAIKAACKIV